MRVVSDASPLNVLVRTGLVDLLPRLFGTVVIPEAVAAELSRDATPAPVREWLTHRPDWLEICAPAAPADPSLPRHLGEREALQLALELKADALLVEGLRPRRQAASMGITVVGTIGILERAASLGWIDLKVSLRKLRETDFYVSERLLAEVLRRHEESNRA